MNWSTSEEEQLKRLINELIDTRLLQHLYSHHPHPNLGPIATFGGDSSDAKPEALTTPLPTPEMAITELSNFRIVLGDLLEDLDIRMNQLTKCKNTLQLYFNSVRVGDSGPPVVESSDSGEKGYT